MHFKLSLNAPGGSPGAWFVEDLATGKRWGFDIVTVLVETTTVTAGDPMTGRLKGWLVGTGKLVVTGRTARIEAEG